MKRYILLVLDFVLCDLVDASYHNGHVFYVVEKTMEKLAVVLDGYDSVEIVPSLFILMGNFCSRPCNLSYNAFSNLRSVLHSYHFRLRKNLFIPNILLRKFVYISFCSKKKLSKLGQLLQSPV